MASRQILAALSRSTPALFRPITTPTTASFTLPIATPARSFTSHAAPAAAAKHDDHGHHGKEDHGHGHGAAGHDSHDHHHGVTHGGVTISPPKPWQTYGAHFFGGLMWFWIFYRFSNDYKVFLGLEHPWDGHHEGGDHGHEGNHAAATSTHDDDDEDEEEEHAAPAKH